MLCTRTAHDIAHGQSMASITKHGDGWRAFVLQHGKRISKVFQTKRAAQAWALVQEAQSDRLQDHTFANLVAEYTARVSSKKPGAVWETRRMAVMLEHFGPATMLRDIDAPQISRWRDARAADVSASTINREKNLLHHMFSVARDEWRWIEHDPFRGVRMPASNPPRHQLWTWQLIKRVLRTPRIGKTAEVQAAFHIALRTGMRLQEVLAAPANFDSKRRVVSLAKTKTEIRANIPIGRIAAKLLTRQPFTVGANEASTLFARLCKELLIDDLRFHDARASALTWMARKVDVLTLARVSRHKNLKILMSVYYRETSDQVAARL